MRSLPLEQPFMADVGGVSLDAIRLPSYLKPGVVCSASVFYPTSQHSLAGMAVLQVSGCLCNLEICPCTLKLSSWGGHRNQPGARNGSSLFTHEGMRPHPLPPPISNPEYLSSLPPTLLCQSYPAQVGLQTHSLGRLGGV